MPDGKRRRRHSTNPARRRWYANQRARRFARRIWEAANAETGNRYRGEAG